MRRKIKVVKRLEAKGYPTASPRYAESHDEADNAEKRHYPRAYKELKKIEKHMGRKELLASHNRHGDVTIEYRVPKRDRKDIILHEDTERKADKRLKKKKK